MPKLERRKRPWTKKEEELVEQLIIRVGCSYTTIAGVLLRERGHREMIDLHRLRPQQRRKQIGRVAYLVSKISKRLGCTITDFRNARTELSQERLNEALAQVGLPAVSKRRHVIRAG